MDTDSADYYGAVELTGVLDKLAKSEFARKRVLEEFGATDGAVANDMIHRGDLTGVLGDRVHDFFADEIENEATAIWSGVIFDPDDEGNVDSEFPVGISEYCGVFFAWSLESDNAGYFLTLEDARGYVFSNWDNVRENI